MIFLAGNQTEDILKLTEENEKLQPINRSATFTVGQLNIIETGHNERVLINTCFEGCHFPTQPCILVRQFTKAFRLLYVLFC